MIAIGIIAALFVFVLAEALYITYSGTPVSRPNIQRSEQMLGQGPALRYVVMGDSTAVSQGGDYSSGYASKTAGYLAQTHAVTWLNVAVPGARAADVDKKQLPQTLKESPDLVLIAVGANDITHLTPPSSVVSSIRHTITKLQQQNPNVRIVLTGSPDMGSVPRFPQPVRWFAGERTKSLNAHIIKLTSEKHVYFAPIAQQTGPEFRKHPELFAADKFHPTTDGYDLWTPVIIKTLQEAGL